MNLDSKIYVAGHNGMVGSAIVRKLKTEGYTNIITFTRDQYDLTRQAEVEELFVENRPEYVFLCAAKVGGIEANNTYRGEFIYNNLMISTNIINAAYEFGVKRLINLGSTCIYPKEAKCPIVEERLLTGPLEETNKPYALAKIAAVEMCDAYNKQYNTSFISLMPCNLYGINDTYDDKNSHIIPALIQRMHNAKLNEDPFVEVWGDGTPLREFLFVDDLAEACVEVMEADKSKLTYTLYNVGSGDEYAIYEIAYLIAQTVGYNGQIKFNTDYPNGTMRKVVSSEKIFANLLWEANTPLFRGLMIAYEDFLQRFGE